MLNWRALGLGALLALAAAGTAGAETSADGVVLQLQEQGYVEFEVSRTLLGRIQVIAVAPDGGQREIVFNPATGEILRDYVQAVDGSEAVPQIIDRPVGGAAEDDGDPEVLDGNGGQGNGNGGNGGQGNGNGGQGNGNGGQSNGNGGQGNGNGNGGQGNGSGGHGNGNSGGGNG